MAAVLVRHVHVVLADFLSASSNHSCCAVLFRCLLALRLFLFQFLGMLNAKRTLNELNVASALLLHAAL
jgi:hypothetical protein